MSISELNNSYGINNRVNFSSAPQLKMKSEVKFDTVEISNNKNNTNNKNNNISKNIAIAGSLAIACIGICLGVKKVSHLRNLQEEFSQIFSREVSLKEAYKLEKKYQKLLKIDDINNFEVDLRNELRKDFGLENIPIKFKKDASKTYTTLKLDEQAYNIIMAKWTDKEILFKNYTHEFRHIKQDELSYRCGRDNFFKAKYPREIYILKKQNPNATQEELDNFIKTRINPFYDNIWGKYPKIPSDRKEHELVQKLNMAQKDHEQICNELARQRNDEELYFTNFIEKDARDAERAMERIFLKNK